MVQSVTAMEYHQPHSHGERSGVVRGAIPSLGLAPLNASSSLSYHVPCAGEGGEEALTAFPPVHASPNMRFLRLSMAGTYQYGVGYHI